MRRLNRCWSLGSDRGASAVFVALVAVILFGIAAWVIDGSALYQERRELQNGADAAALAIAMDCAVGDCGNFLATAESYIDDNASDGDSGLQPGGVTFPTSNSVRVAVETADAGPDIDNDPETIDYVFAPVLGRDGFQVLAAATAAWGTVGGGATLPLIISVCEFGWATESLLPFSTASFPTASFPTGDVTIFFHESGNDTGNNDGPVVECDAHPGHDSNDDGLLPGGFGWLQEGECVAELTEYYWVGSKPGAAAPRDCDPNELYHSTVFIPIFDDVTEPGGGGLAKQCSVGPGGKCYHVAGFGAFYITGLRFPGGPDWRQVPPCDPPDTCISGYFTEYVFSNATGGGGTDFGAKAVWLVS